MKLTGELAAILANVDELVRTAQELQARLKARMTNEVRRDQTASDWSERRGAPNRQRW
jgi:hypothetical protein